MRNIHFGLCLALLLGAAGCTHAGVASVDDWSGLGSRDGFARYGDDRPRARGVVTERRPAREFVLGNSFAQLDGDDESSDGEPSGDEPEFFEEISREDEDDGGGEDDGGEDDGGEIASDEGDESDESDESDEDPGESGDDERAGA